MKHKILGIFILCMTYLTAQAQVVPNISPFDGIDARGNFRLEIHTQQPTCSVELLATAETAKQISVKVQDHIVFIKDQRPNHHEASRVTVIVNAPSIHYLHLSGMTFGALPSLESAIDPSLEVNLSGASQFKPTGNIKQLTLHNSGSGQFQGFGLTTQTTTITASGHSQSQVHASKELSGHLSGMSRLQYHGNPKRNLRLSGMAKLVQIQ